jgi:aminocarboxymuconate-semialdehyde decarboxylase
MHARMDKSSQGDVAQRAPSSYAQQMVYDSIVHAPKPLRFLADLVGIDRLVLGTDYSFPPADLSPLASLRAAAFSAADIKKITVENPHRLFPRLNGSR